jgi:hypothetical protein
MQAVKTPEAAGTEQGTIVVAWEEEQPNPTAIFVATDKPEDGSYYGKYYSVNELARFMLSGSGVQALQAP